MKNQRLSLADFKMNKLDSKNEIDKLLGGTEAGCHLTAGSDGLLYTNDTKSCGIVNLVG